MQDKSPTATDIDKLGLYLLVSLFFIVATMLEFVIALLVKRRAEHRVSPIDKPPKRYLGIQMKRALFNSVFAPTEQLEESMEKNDCRKVEHPTNINTNSNKIDFTSALLFPTAYAIFNIIYWYCLMQTFCESLIQLLQPPYAYMIPNQKELKRKICG